MLPQYCFVADYVRIIVSACAILGTLSDPRMKGVGEQANQSVSTYSFLP